MLGIFVDKPTNKIDPFIAIFYVKINNNMQPIWMDKGALLHLLFFNTSNDNTLPEKTSKQA